MPVAYVHVWIKDVPTFVRGADERMLHVLVLYMRVDG